jgi:hypothetical protein
MLDEIATRLARDRFDWKLYSGCGVPECRSDDGQRTNPYPEQQVGWPLFVRNMGGAGEQFHRYALTFVLVVTARVTRWRFQPAIARYSAKP